MGKTYNGKPALEDIGFSVQAGEFVTLLGPSGCGKTTVLRILAGFEQPDTGRVLLDGRDMAAIPPEQRCVNTVFQSYALFPHMNVYDNVAFGLRMEGVAESEIRASVTEALSLVRLAGMERRKPDSLSGGQQQRVAIARALIKKPLVLLLDEPLSALDYRLRKNMQVELKELQQRLGITFILVTHDQEEAFAMSDRVVVMNEGAIEQVGAPREIYEEPATLYVAEFVGEINILNGVLHSWGENTYRATVEGAAVEVHTSRRFADQTSVLVLVRPEDFQVESLRTLEKSASLTRKFEEGGFLLGEVRSTSYKGATYDLTIRLDNGKRILATQFFNEDSEDVAFASGDKVAVHWIPGWEVVFRDKG